MLERHIDNLKERPHHERRAVALTIAGGVVVVLFIGWAFIFFTDLHASNQTNAQAQEVSSATTTSEQ